MQDTNIPVKIWKDNVNFFAEYIYLQYSRNQKNNYRPISILPLISKISEKLICRQLSNCFNNILSKFQCGFRKGYGPQHSLLLIVDK